MNKMKLPTSFVPTSRLFQLFVANQNKKVLKLYTHSMYILIMFIKNQYAKMFQEEVRVVTVPHTGVVKTCHKCRGNGGMTCGECYGKARPDLATGFFKPFRKGRMTISNTR